MLSILFDLANDQSHRRYTLDALMWTQPKEVATPLSKHHIAAIREALHLGAHIREVWYMKCERLLHDQRVGRYAQHAECNRVSHIAHAVAHHNRYLTMCKRIRIVVVEILTCRPYAMLRIVHLDATLRCSTPHHKEYHNK